jgi:hypothetical protein
LTQRPQNSSEEAVARAASLIAQALNQIQQSAGTDATVAREELAASRKAIETLARRMEAQMAEEKEQRLLLAGQLTNLATSLDSLVSHLQDLSQLMADVLEHLVTPAREHAPAEKTTMHPAAKAAEPSFQAGGEGISLILASVPGFQALMDIQKALSSLEQVESASVERFQEGDSRLLLQLRAPVTASQLVAALRDASGLNLVVEEARPELLRLHLKVV